MNKSPQAAASPDVSAVGDLRRVALDLGLTAIEPRDASILRRHLANCTLPSYGDAWTYVVQAVNGYSLGLPPLGYKRISGEGFVSVGFFLRPTDGLLCAHIVSPAGESAGSLSKEIVLRLRREYAMAVYIKKAGAAVRDRLISECGCRDDRVPAWHAVAPQEDDTFAELVIDVNHTLTIAKGRRNTELADKWHRFHTRARGEPVEWRDLDEASTKAARSVIQSFFRGKTGKGADTSTPHDYENMLVFPGSDGGLVTRRVLLIGSVPAALVVFEQLGESATAGLYCNLALYEQYAYLSEFVVVEACGWAAESGLRLLNLGGSESAGLDAFKRKFLPVSTRLIPWLYCG